MDFFLLRVLERIVAVVIGGLSIYLGYRLFRAVKATGEGSAEIKLPHDVTVMVSRVGPGVFFALFGAAIVAASLAFPIHYSETDLQTLGGTRMRTQDISGVGPAARTGVAPAVPAMPVAPGAVPDAEANDLKRRLLRELDFRGEIVTVQEEANDLKRRRVREHVALLNQLLTRLDPSLSEAQRKRVRDRTVAAKLYLMQTVWGPDWGRFEDFQLWAEGGDQAIESEAFRRAVVFFTFGQEESP